MSHTIYHVPGVKVGCTTEFENRKSWYLNDNKWGPDTQFEIIEVLEGFDDQLAGDREWDWADSFGYKRGQHYTHAKKMRKSGSKKGGEIGGKRVLKLGKMQQTRCSMGGIASCALKRVCFTCNNTFTGPIYFRHIKKCKGVL